MQSLQPASNSPARACAQQLLEVMPEVMYYLRGSFHRHPQGKARGLTVPQVRLLVAVQRRPQASISEIAQFLGVSLPATSRMVEAAVARGLLRRATSGEDRRRMALQLTALGGKLLRMAKEVGQNALAERFAGLAAEEAERLRLALAHLGQLFRPESRK